MLTASDTLEKELWEGVGTISATVDVVPTRVCDEATVVADPTPSELCSGGTRLVVGCGTESEVISTESMLVLDTLGVVTVATSALVVLGAFVGV